MFNVLLTKFCRHRSAAVFIYVYYEKCSDGHSSATSAATFSVAVAAAPLLFFVTSEKRQCRWFLSQESGSVSALNFKLIIFRWRHSFLDFFDLHFQTLLFKIFTLHFFHSALVTRSSYLYMYIQRSATCGSFVLMLWLFVTIRWVGL